VRSRTETLAITASPTGKNNEAGGAQTTLGGDSGGNPLPTIFDVVDKLFDKEKETSRDIWS
jgi:hypothetical protein